MPDPRNCVVTLCLYNRPEYTARALAALRACRGIDACTLLPHVEPGCPEVRALVEAVDFAECLPTWNPARLGCNANTIAALDDGFARSDFAVHVEDDVLLAPDALDYFWWARAAYGGDAAVATVSGYHREAAAPGPDAHHDVHRREWFHPWGWGTWRGRWRQLRAAATAAAGRRTTWDTLLGRYVVERGLHEVYPRLSRAQNIGVKSTLHPATGFFTPEWHAANQHCPHWAGDGRAVPAGTFREVTP